MTRSRDLSAATYARTIERLWEKLADRPVVLSPRDWSRISDWHARRIPLEIVREAMEEQAGRQRRGPVLRTLSGVERAVEEAWAVISQGRVGSPPDGPAAGADRAVPESAWQRRLEQEEPGSRLHSLLSELLDRLARGEDRAALDEELDRALPEAAPGKLLEAIRRQIDGELEDYRSRMAPEEFSASRRHGCLERLRRRLDLPRLSHPGDRG